MKNPASDHLSRVPSEEKVFVYRGPHAGHPAMEAARRGIVYPGDLNGKVTPEEHNLGGVSARSQFTSWTYRFDEAVRHATDRGAGGLILRLQKADPPPAASWYWQESPNEFDEDEILLHGIRIDAEVVFSDRAFNRPAPSSR